MRTFENILVPVDLGEESSWREALPVAIDQAQHAGGKLHIATVVSEEPPQLAAWLPDDYGSKMIAHAQTELKKLVGAQIPKGMEVELHVRQGSIYSEIVKLAKALDINMIVMASHRPELKDFLLGPNAARVLRHAECSVLVVR